MGASGGRSLLISAGFAVASDVLRCAPMTDNAAIYLDAQDPIPIAFVQRNAPFANVAPHPPGGAGYFVAAAGWQMAINPMPAAGLPQHLQGFAGWIAQVTGGGATPAAQSVLQRLATTKQVLGCVVEPGFDAGGHARRTIASLAGAGKGLLFAHNAVFDWDGSLLVGPPGSPVGFLPAELTPAQRWALAAGAIVTRYFEEDVGLLGGAPPSAEARAAARAELADPWDIGRRGQLTDMLKYLSQPQSETHYGKLAAQVAAGTARPSDSVSAEDIAFVQANGAMIGARGLLADYLVRLVRVAGLGYLAGFACEGEAWNWILPAMVRLQQAHGSWQEMGHHYLLGVAYRRGWDEDLATSYKEVVADPASPWNVTPWSLPLT
jgi:hypothetical protein